MKFVGMSKEDRKLVLEALELASRARFESLEACQPRTGLPAVKPDLGGTAEVLTAPSLTLVQP